MNSNRCPECGGVANHIITDVKGDSYYRCLTGLTTLGDVEGRLASVGHIVPCDTIIHRGEKYTGTIAYVTDRGHYDRPENQIVRTLAVTAGKERR